MADDSNAQKAQNFMNRGRQALEGRRYDLAVDMLTEAVNAAPQALEARKLLRAAQIGKYKENPPSSFSLKMQGLSNMFARQKVMALAKKGAGTEAMAEAEKLLAQN